MPLTVEQASERGMPVIRIELYMAQHSTDTYETEAYLVGETVWEYEQKTGSLRFTWNANNVVGLEFNTDLDVTAQED